MAAANDAGAPAPPSDAGTADAGGKGPKTKKK
jgi:hypothetical protein